MMARARAVTHAASGAGVALAVGAVTALVFLPAVRNGFVEFDDQQNIVDNPLFRGLDPSRLRWMLTTFHLGHWQPLSWLSLAVDHALWGLDPHGYHLTNVLLHAANAALVFVLAQRLLVRAGMAATDAGGAAAAGALLWALHPLRVESVAWVTERRDVLSTFFVLLALCAYLVPEERRGRVAWTFVWGTLATLAKASAMVLPALLVVLDVYPLGRLGGARGRSRAVWLEKVPFVALALVSMTVAVAAQRNAGALYSLADLPVAERIGGALYALGFTLWKTVLPIRLSPLYEYPFVGPLDPRALAGLLTVAGVVAVALLLGRRGHAVAAALAWYVAAIAPTLGFSQAGAQLTADRYTYVAGMAPAVLAGAVAPRARVACASVVLALAVLTLRQIPTWHDGRTLWTRAVALDPDNASARVHLANVAQLEGDVDGAMAELERVLRARPSLAEAHTELAVLLTVRGQYDEATAHYREALRLDPSPRAEVLSNMGVLLLRSGRADEALTPLREAVRQRPDLPGVHENLAYALAATGDRVAAAHELEEALRLDPGATSARQALERLRTLPP